MKVSDWLAPERIDVPLAVDSLEEALLALLGRVSQDAAPAPVAPAKWARDLAFGSRGDVLRVGEEAVLVLAREDFVSEPTLFLGVSMNPFLVTAEGREGAGHARAVILAFTPDRPEQLRVRLVPVLRRFLATDEGRLALYAARSRDEIVEGSGLLELEVPDRPRVVSVVREVPGRVHPDTPVVEVFELMTRRGLHVVPVVGEDHQVLGVITSGDALAHLVPRTRGGEDPRNAVTDDRARDVMTRAVLCVSEDQALEEVAALMVNRDVEQLPVVREGAFVGFVTRDGILRALLGGEPAQP
jgi:CBS domain-containing protein